MDICPNCGTEVADSVTRCPACGLARDLPVHDSAGSVVGRTFTTIRPSTPGTNPPGTPGSGGASTGSGTGGPTSWLGSVALEPGPRRSRSLAMLGVALGIAVVLGVVVAVILNATVLGPARTAEPGAPGDTSAAPTAPGTGRSPSAPPSPTSGSPSASTSSAAPSSTPPARPTVAPSVVLDKVRTGVVGVVASTCSPAAWSGHGTGALVGRDLVVTAWPVVARAVSVAIIDARGRPVAATVQRADPALGIAVLRTARPVSGHQFDLGKQALDRGQRWYGVAADRAQGKDATATRVQLGRVGATARLGNDSVSGVALTSLASKDHLAGGAVVDAHGRLLGVTARYPGRDHLVVLGAEHVRRVLQHAGKPSTPSCDTPLGPSGALRPVKGNHALLERYFSRINGGDYDAVWSMLAPQLQKNRKATIDGWWSSYVFNVRISKAGGDTVRADFDSVFAEGHGPKGRTCARWSLQYRFEDGRIASAKAVGGGPGYRPC